MIMSTKSVWILIYIGLSYLLSYYSAGRNILDICLLNSWALITSLINGIWSYTAVLILLDFL